MRFYEWFAEQKISESCFSLQNLIEDISYWNKDFIISELSYSTYGHISKWLKDNYDELSFNDLFKNEQTRIAIPLSPNTEIDSILDKIEQLGIQINYDNGTVQSGKRQIRLGKFILDKKSPFDEKEKSWWSHSGNPIQELKDAEKLKDYVLIISRHPIDIVRMSDHDGWSSCHSQGGSYFQCAIDEAEGAGAIAYVVRESDLRKVSLNDDEIFTDKDRGVDGITPLSRVRLRKFVHKEEGYDFAVPEDRIYGKNIPGMLETVRKWALESQQEKIGNKRVRMKDFILVGGYYRDTEASELFNLLFGDELDSGDAEYGGKNKSRQALFDEYEEEIERIQREFNNFKIVDFSAEVERFDDGMPYVYYRGYFNLRLPDNVVLNIPEDDTSQRPTERPSYKLKELIKKWASDNDVYLEDVEIYDNVITGQITDDSVGVAPDDLRSFVNLTLKPIDKNADFLLASLYKTLVSNGYLASTKVTSMYDSGDEHDYHFNNFEWHEDDNDLTISLKKPIQILGFFPKETPIVFTRRTEVKHQYEVGYWQDYFKNTLMQELNNWADALFERYKNQPLLFKDMDNLNKRAFSQEFNIEPQIEIKSKRLPYGQENTTGAAEMHLLIGFTPFTKDQDFDDAIEFVRFLDQNFSAFENLIQKISNDMQAQWNAPSTGVQTNTSPQNNQLQQNQNIQDQPQVQVGQNQNTPNFVNNNQN